MKTTQIISRIRSKVLEETSELVADTKILEDINFANNDITKKAFTNASIVSASVALTSGIGTLPATFGTAYGDAVDSDSNFYREISIEDFLKETQQYSFTIEAGQIKVYPTTTASVTLRFYPKTVTLSATVDPTVDELLQECLIYGGMYRIFQDLQDESLSQYYKTLYETSLNEKLAVLSRWEETNQTSGQFLNGISIV